MHPDLLAILRCPFCGNRLELVESLFHESRGGQIANGVIACECCVFPVVDGIPVMHLQPAATAARERVEAGKPELARHLLLGLETAEQRERFDTAVHAPDATFKRVLDALGEQLEAGYLYHRFSDPTFLVGDAVVRAVGRAALHGGGRAIDVCGGAGHLTRALLPLTEEQPVLADLYYPKIWLARRFTAPGVAPVCCDGNAPLPFARGAFTFAVCSDALMYVWMKRLLVSEMIRLVDGTAAGTVLVNHTHNQLVWSPSHGQALTPAGYRALFERVDVVAFGESMLFAQIVGGGPLNLTSGATDSALADEAALTLVATRAPGVLTQHPLDGQPPHTTPHPRARSARPIGEWQINPLYEVSEVGGRLHGRLRFPSPDYESEYAACRAYLPEEISVDTAALGTLREGAPGHGLDDLIRRRAILDLPAAYGTP